MLGTLEREGTLIRADRHDLQFGLKARIVYKHCVSRDIHGRNKVADPAMERGFYIVFKRGWVYMNVIKIFSRWKPRWAVLYQRILLDERYHMVSDVPMLLEMLSKHKEVISLGNLVLELHKDRGLADLGTHPQQVVPIESGSVVSPFGRDGYKFILCVNGTKHKFSTLSSTERDEWCEIVDTMKYPDWPSLSRAGKLGLVSNILNDIVPKSIRLVHDDIFSAVDEGRVFDRDEILNIVKNYKTGFVGIGQAAETSSANYERLQKVCNLVTSPYDFSRHCSLLYELDAEFRNAAVYHVSKFIDEHYLDTQTRIEDYKVQGLSFRMAGDYLCGDEDSIYRQEKDLEFRVKAHRNFYSLGSAHVKNPVFCIVTYKGFHVEVSVEKALTKVFDPEAPEICTLKDPQVIESVGNGTHYKRSIFGCNGRNFNIISRALNVSADTDGTFYLSGAQALLLPDIDDNHQIDPNKNIRLEWINICARQVDLDVLRRADDEGVATLYEICRDLRTSQTKYLASKLDRLDVILWNSTLITEYFHAHGVNMRYLGVVCDHARLPHVRNLCYIEMMSRAFKHILNAKVRNSVHYLMRIGATRTSDEIHKLVADLYVSLFCSSKGTCRFIDEILTPMIAKRFGYTGIPYDRIQKMQLFHAMNYQCGIVWEDGDYDFRDSSSLHPRRIINFIAREKGMIRLPEMYPYFRLNEYSGFSGLGFLSSAKICDCTGLRGPDILSYNLSGNHGKHQSPVQNYFSAVPRKSGDPHNISDDSVADYSPPSILLMSGLYFRSLGNIFQHLPHPTSSTWMFLVSHYYLFNAQKPREAMLYAVVSLLLNKNICRSKDNREKVVFGLGDPVLESQIYLIMAQANILLAKNKVSPDMGLGKVIGNIKNILDMSLVIGLSHEKIEGCLGPNHPLLARHYQLLSCTFWHCKDKEKAVLLQEKALEYSVKGLGKGHSWSLKTQLLFGCYLLGTGYIQRSLEVLRECIQDVPRHRQCVTSPIEDDSDIFISDVHYFLAEAYRASGSLEIALEHSLKAKTMKQMLIGSGHQSTTRSCCQVGDIAFQQFCGEINIGDRSMADMVREGIKITTTSMRTHLKIALDCYEGMFYAIRYSGSSKENGSQVSSQVCEVTRKIVFLKICASLFSRRETVDTVLRRYEDARRGDVLKPLLKAVVGKLVRYGPIPYFDSLFEKACGTACEPELLAVFSLLEGS